MSPQDGTNESNNNKNNKYRKTKRAAVLSITGALVGAAILLSGLSLISNHGYYNFAIAQQQNTTTDGNSEGASGGAQSGNATTTGAGGGGGGNLSISEIRTNLEQALTALQNNDTESATMYLQLTLGAIGDGGGTEEGNLTSSSTAAGGDGGNTTTTGSEEVTSMGGTGPADDYDPTADD